MALDKKIIDALKGLEDKTILKMVEELDDKAEAKEKVQKANEDLISQRKDWEDKEKEYKNKVSEYEKSIKEQSDKISTLEKDKLTPEEIAALKKTESLQADYNKLMDELKTIKTEFSSEVEKRQQSEEKAKVASKKAAEQALKTSITNELAKHKIVGSQCATAIYSIFGNGMAKLDENEDGEVQHKFFTKNENDEPVTSDLSKMIQSFAEKNDYLVSSSGKTGSGQTHDRKTHNNNYVDNYQEAKRAELDNWEKHFTN